MKKYIFFLLMLSGYSLQGISQSQTRTCTRLNDYRGPYVNSYPRATASNVAFDDNVYAYSRKLSPGQSYANLLLQGFGFSIPANATIEGVTVTARRFKKGKGSIRDYFAMLVKSPENGYGVRWTNPDNYPATESPVTYFQNGTGYDGAPGNQFYLWTPDMINHRDFGVRIDVYTPVGGSVEVNYDLVEITVAYSVPLTLVANSRKYNSAIEPNLLKEPAIYPNPFATTTNLQFTADDNGKATVELYSLSGTKIQTIFSGNVVKGNVYNVKAGDSRLTKGMYVYKIRQGIRTYTGNIIKQ